MAESTAVVDEGAQQSPTTRRLVVVRHGERQDEADDAWGETADEPWDPPLSKKGREQAFEAGRRILEDRGVVIKHVVTSPFLRCLETTAMLLEALDLPWGICTIDCRFSEVLSSGVILRGSAAGSGALEGGRDGERGEDWLWRGQALKERLMELLPPGASQEVCFAASALPNAEETHGAAHGRYCRAFESLMMERSHNEAPQQQESAEPTDAVLVVTHGEGVRAAVDMAVPRALVYEVLHCGFVALVPGHQDESRGGSAPGTAPAVPPGEGLVTAAAAGAGQGQGASSAAPSEPSSSAPPPPAKAQEGPGGVAAADREEEGPGRVLPHEEEAKASEGTACPSSGSTDSPPAASGTTGRGKEEGGRDSSRPSDEAYEEGTNEHAGARGGGGGTGGASAGTEGGDEDDGVPHPGEEGQQDPDEGGLAASLAGRLEVEFSDGVSWLLED